MASEKSDTQKQEGGNPVFIPGYCRPLLTSLTAQIKSADMVCFPAALRRDVSNNATERGDADGGHRCRQVQPDLGPID
jgi:hypothetical protein